MNILSKCLECGVGVVIVTFLMFRTMQVDPKTKKFKKGHDTLMMMIYLGEAILFILNLVWGGLLAYITTVWVSLTILDTVHLFKIDLNKKKCSLLLAIFNWAAAILLLIWIYNVR